MRTCSVSVKWLALSLTLAFAAVVALAFLLNQASAHSSASSPPTVPASEPPQDPPRCLADIAIVLDVGGSMQEDTRCYGCWEPDPVNEYPAGTTFPLPFTIVPTSGLAIHCQPSEPLNWPLGSPDWYVSIEAEHYSRYLTEADYHRNRTEYPKTWWTMQRQPNAQASGPDARGAFMMVGPHSEAAIHVLTLNDIVPPPDLWTTPRLDYGFTVPVDGTYYVWMRAQGGVDWWDNAIARRRVHVGLNGFPMATGETPLYGPYTAGAAPDNWRWSRVLTLSDLNATGPGDPYTLNVWAAGPGFRLDKIVITNSPRIDLDRGGRPLDWDFPGIDDAGPVETQGRTDWACMGELDPRFRPIDPLSGDLDDLYDDYQPIRAVKEAVKSVLQDGNNLDPTQDQVGYVVYSDTSHIEHELYCLVAPGACADWSPITEAVEATSASGLHTHIAEGMWDGLRLLLPGPEPAWDPPHGFPSRVPGQMHYGRAGGSPVLILLSDGIPDRYPDLPSGYGTCYEHDLWPDQPGETLDQRRGRECVVYFAHLARDNGVTIFTVALGAQADLELLAHVAEVAGGWGWFYFAPSVEELDAVFDHIAKKTRFTCWPPGVNLINYATPDYLTATGDRIDFTIQTTFQLGWIGMRAIQDDSRFGNVPHGLNLISYFPDGTDFVTADEPYELYNDHISWPISHTEELAHWARRHLTLEVKGAQKPALINTAQLVDYTGPVYATATVTTTFLPALTYDLEKHTKPSTTGTSSSQVTFTLWLTTNGPHFPAVLTDRLPPDTVFVTATAPFSPAQPVAGQPLVWPLTPTHFGPDGVVSRTLVLSVSQIPFSGILTNTALAGDYLGYHVVQDSTVARLAPWPTYGLSKIVTPSPVVTVGQRVTYSLVVTTNRPDLLVTLTDTLPVGATFLSASGDYTPAAPGPSDVLAWPLTLADFVKGAARRTLVLSVTTVPDDGLLINTAGVAGVVDSAALTVLPDVVLRHWFYLPLVLKGG